MNLKQLLKTHGLSHEMISRLLIKNKCFKYRQQVSDWVRGIRLPDLISVYYLSKILHESMEVVVEACLKSAGVI